MTTQTVSVASSGDDILSYSASLGTISGIQTTDTSAVLGRFVNNYFYEVFALFQSLDFAQGDIIDAASVEYELAGNTVVGANTLNLYWAFHNTDNASIPTTVSATQTARDNQTTKISDAVDSSRATSPTRLNSPELKTALQDIADRVGWTANNNVLLEITYNSSTGQDYVQIYMYDSGGGADKMVLSVTYTTGGGTTYTKSFTESVGVTDSISKIISIQLSDSVVTADEALRVIQTIKQEIATTNEVFTKTVAFNKLFQEAVGINEIFGTARTVLGSFMDGLSISESFARQLTKRYSDTVVGGDSLSTNVVTLKALQDQLTVLENQIKTIVKQQNDSVSILDRAYKLITKPFSDSTSNNDSINTELAKNKQLTDSVTLSEPMVKTLQKAISETVSVTDSVLKQVTIINTYTDSVSLTDTVNTLRTQYLNAVDSVAATSLMLRTISKQLSEQITVTDYITKLKNGVSLTWTRVSNVTSATWTRIANATNSIWTKQRRT